MNFSRLTYVCGFRFGNNNNSDNDSGKNFCCPRLSDEEEKSFVVERREDESERRRVRRRLDSSNSQCHVSFLTVREKCTSIRSVIRITDPVRTPDSAKGGTRPEANRNRPTAAILPYPI